MSEKKEELKSLLKLIAPILVAVPAIGVLLWTLHISNNLLAGWAESSLVKAGNQAIEKTVNFREKAAFSADYNASWVESNLAAPTFAEDFHKIAKKQMDTFPYFKLIYFGDNKGNHWLNKRESDGTIRTRTIERLDDSPASQAQLARASNLSMTETEEQEERKQRLAPLLRTSWYSASKDGTLRFHARDPLKAYDPRLRPWYIGAKKAQGQSWINVYTWENKIKGKIKQEAGITVSYPVMHKGAFVGVVGIDLVLDAISEFLGTLHVSPHSQAFIFDAMGRVIGMPHRPTLRISADGHQAERILLSDFKGSPIAEAYANLRRHLEHHDNLPREKPLGPFEMKVLPFVTQGENFTSFFKPLQPFHALDWHIGVIMPESDVKGALTRQFHWIFGGIILIVLMFLSLIPFHLKSEKERRWIRHAFSKYVSPNRVQYLLENPDHLSLGGEYRDCSFVMTDLKGFTSLMEQCGEQSGPEIIVDTLNDYLEGMVHIAFQHEGTLDRIVGDAVAVLFSAPVPQEDHARRAVACALAMDQFAMTFALERRKEGLPFGHTRIGVHSGRVLLGNFGGKAVFDYRALGDPINTAARLESINNQLGTRVCVSEATVSQLSGFHGRLIGNLILKGKEIGIKTYQPLTEAEENTPLIKEYKAAYRLMAAKDPRAFQAFAQALEQWPEDPLLCFHHERLLRGEHGETIIFTDK